MECNFSTYELWKNCDLKEMRVKKVNIIIVRVELGIFQKKIKL